MSESTLKPFNGKLDDNTNTKQQPTLKPFTGALDGEEKGVMGHLKDTGLSALKGAVAVPELAVGIMDMMSDGAVGKTLENNDGVVGFRPKQAKQALSDLHTDQYKAQQQEFADAGKDGNWVDKVVDKTKVAVANPSLIANTVVESVPSMLVGGVLGRASGIANPVVAGAVGEGSVMAGSQAEQIRQETVDGRLTADQSLAGATTGVLGGLIGFAGGRLAQKMGIGDVDTMLVTGRAGPADIAGEIASMPAKSLPRRVVEGAISEGFLEELPQSVSEQILQNLALDKPWHEGIEDAAVMGTLAGMAMGGAANILSGHNTGVEPQDNQQQPGTPILPSAPQLGSSPDSALTGEYIPRENVPQGDNQGRTAFVYDQPSTDTDNLLGNGSSNTEFGAPDNPSSPNGGDYFDTPKPQLPSERMGIDPNTGPMSSAAALAVDSGASPVAQLSFTPEQQDGNSPLSDAVPTNYQSLLDSQTNQSQIDYLEQQFADAKSVPEKAEIRKQINEIKGNQPVQQEQGKPEFKADPKLAYGSLPWSNDIASQALQQFQGDATSLEQANQSLTGKGAATDLIYYKNSPSFSNIEVVDAGDKSIVKLTNAKTGQVIEREYPQELSRFNDFLNGGQQNTTENFVQQPNQSESTETQYNKPIVGADGQNKWFGSQEKADAFIEKKGITTTHQVVQTETKRFEIQPISNKNQDDVVPSINGENQANKITDQIAQLEQQFTAAKSVPQKAKLRKQIDQLKTQQQTEAATQWQSMSPEQRQAVVQQIDVSQVPYAKRLHTAQWDNIGDSVKTRLIGAMNQSSPLQQIDTSANEAATSPLNETPAPSQAQIEAGNYKKGHIKVHGLDISIENPKGSTRSGTDPDGKSWSHEMSDHYGYIKRTKGADNEHIDTYIGSNPDSDQVFIVDQLDQETGNFDEHKVMLGFDSQEDATTAYQSNFDKGWKVGPIRAMNMKQFKDWLKNDDTSKPATESNLHSQPTKTSDKFADNKIFTSDVVAKARERLKKKLGQLNSGIDPEVLIDGMTIAGAYIESGVRKFGDYAKAMAADFGEDIKPYLLSFWEGARNYPNLDTQGMTSVEESKQEFDALNQTANLSNNMKKVVGEKVTKPKAAKKSKIDDGQRQLVQDWGVRFIDGWATNPEHTGQIYTDYGYKDGVKAAFLKNTKQYLESVQKQLEQQGYHLHLDKKGKPEKVSTNEAGSGVSGDVSLKMTHDDGVNVYVTIGESAMSSSHPQRIGIMFRSTTDLSNKSASGFGQQTSSNQWASTDFTAAELATAMDNTAKRLLRSNSTLVHDNHIENLETESNANSIQTKDVSSNDTQPAPADATTGNRDSQSLDDGVAKTSGSSNRDRGVSGRTEVSGRTGTDSVQQRAEPSSGTPRDSGTVRTGRSTTVSEQRELDPATAETSDRPVLDTDFDLQSEDIGKGGLRQKYNDNIATIKILKLLESENRIATPEERKQIAKYAGWGALKGVFDKDNKQWPKEYTELKALLTDVEYKAARASTLNAHYTSKDVVNSIITIVDRLGFKSGRVLEPSVGTGNFFGLMPASLRKKSELHGVELDPITSQIVAALYPSAKIAKATGFQDFQIPAEYFDLVIGNPPFGNEPIVDNDRSPYSGFSIHNYFFAKSIDKLRPGGILAMVVSRNFMDARTNNTRKWIAERADLVAAVRLPNTAFKENAGTEVVTDIIVLRKRSKDEVNNNAQWVETGLQDLINNKTGETTSINVNQYFIDNPQHILGEPTAGGSMYRANEYTVESINYPLDALLRNWVSSNIPENIYQPISRTDVMTSANYSVPDGVKVGSFFINGQGDVLQRGEDELGSKTAQSWLSPNNKAMERMKGMIALRDTLRDQMRLEKSLDADTKQIEANRKKLNELYDQFQKNYGYLNNQTNRRVFLDDTESALVQALEFDYDRGISKLVAEREGVEQRPESATRADIFARRVLFPPANNIKVHNANDALLASLNYKGKVDLDYMAGLYDKPVNEIVSELGDAVYSDPIRGVVMADEYLSGDVKTKLEEAQAIAKDNSEFKRNVDALKKVIPKDKLPSEIHATLGANFIPVNVYQQFAKEVTGVDSTFRYLKSTGQWIATINSAPDTALNVGKWGIEKMPATEILTRTMAGQGVVVTRTVKMADGSTRTEVLEKETEAAREKQAALKVEWQRWLWADPDRAENIAAIYNEKMNRIVNRKFDGSHLTFPGMNPAMALLPHQKNAVWRILQDRQVLLDHVVGAGKTFEIVTAFMEMRRLGIARKPFIAVPNHLTLQWRSEFNRLYPGSNILAATPDDFSKGNREKFFSKIITGDWDAVIVGHSSLKKIALPPETEKAVLEEQIHEISSAIEEVKRDRGDRNIIRDMENIKARLENRMKLRIQNLGERDNVVTFDELGADAFAVDELHEFKNLFYNTTMQRVPGMGNPKGSDKAFDLFVKLQWMFNTFGDDNAAAIGATGTPVSNSLVEMFNMQRLLQYPTLKANDLHVFDAWAKQFGSVESVYEVSPSGTGFRQSNRFSKFKNLSALMALYNSFADTVTLDDLKAQEIARGKTFPVPKIVGGRPQNIVAKRSEQVADFMGTPELEMVGGQPVFQFDPLNGDTFAIVPQDNGSISFSIFDEDGGVKTTGISATEEEARLALVEYALTPKIFVDEKSILGQFNNLKKLNKETKGKINALSLTGQANKAGLDYRLIDPTAPDFKDSKINKAVAHTFENYQKWNKDKGTQLIFCDMSIPLSARSGFANKERRIYVRNDGNLIHKKGTMHTIEGHEDIPFFVVKEGGGKDKTSFAIYDAVSGQRVKSGMPSKTMAIEQATALINNDNSRQKWIDAIEQVGEIEQELIDEYNNEHEIDAEATESITRDDIAGSSGATQFSVYDDIKTKLVAQGIPEREIAFIHDYSTPSAKEKLFKAVNKGAVRVLLGSTQKMGAGTNVQERLVALHHIDAPWKPSDLEQREGRIVRRGNKLYERDPDNFEVAIYRYATEQTYDTRRWQILEHKARGIEQLRNYDGSLNEIDDIEGEAANAADMKAAASGDPLILEETQLRNEVRRLETLQSANVDEKQMLRSRIRQNQCYIDETAPSLLNEYQSLIDTANKHPVPADKDGFVGVKINRQSYGNRDDAVKAIESQLRNTFAGQREAVFNYRGITFSLENIAGIVYLNAPTEQMVTFDTAKDKLPSPSGMLTRLANYIGRLNDYINDVKHKVEDAKKQIESMLQQLEQPFTQAQDLINAREAHKRVQRRLIAKGPDIPAHQKPILEKAINKQRAELEKQGLSGALKEFEGINGKYNNQNTSTKNDSDTPLYSRSTKRNSGSTVQQVKDVLIDRFGKDTINELERLGKLEIIQDYSVEGVEGYYHNGKAVLIASNLTDQSVIPTFLHELGGHAGFQNMMNQKQYNELMNQFNKLVEQGNPVAMAAKLLAEREQGSERQHLEYLPYLLTLSSTMEQRNVIQRNALQKLINNIVTYVKATLFDNFGINLNLNPNDMVALAERMIEKSSYNGGNVNSPLYSRQFFDNTINTLNESIKQLSAKSIKDRTEYKWTDWLGVGLQTLGRRQLTEIYSKILPQLNKYNELAAQMDADKNDAGAEADNIVREWSKLRDERQLAELMHDATLAKIDPAKPYVSGDSISKYKQLRDAYNSLSPEAQAMYLKARDAYKKHYAQVHQAIKERIQRSELSNEKKSELMKQMDNQFFGYVKGVYFPLSRFGKYIVVMRDANGAVESVSRAETMGEAQALRSELMQKYPNFKVDRVILDKEFSASRDAVGRGFMTSLFAEVDNLGLSTAEQAEFEDTLSQLYLSSMPDLSWAKHGIHRKGTAGFSQDARRAFAQNMFHGAGYLAKLRYGDQLAQQLDDMQKHATEQGKQDNSYDQPTAQRVIDEMNKRHDILMNPKSHPLSSALTSLGFVYYLGLSPAAAMVNLSQTALVAYPIMGAKWGFDKAATELLKASNDFRKGVEFHKVKWEGAKTDLYKTMSSDISKFLSKDEKHAYDEAVSRGVIDVTQAHDLAGIAQGEDSGIMWKTRPIMRAASTMFHNAERFNREVTFIAAYRLARQSGAKHDLAFDQAVDATYRGHFDYSSGNRPRIMQGNVAKVLLLFKQFGQNMIYTLARQTYQSIKGETEAERTEARKSLGAILAMHATFAGVLGLPMVGMLLSLASWAGGDDDDPWDAEVALRNYLAEAFGAKISNLIMKGAPRAFTPVDLSGRVGINNLLLPDVQEGLEGQRWAESAMAGALGPVAGIGTNLIKGGQEISEGQNLRGIETMLPVFLKNFAKTYRYGNEGVQDKTGVAIMDDVDSMDLLVQGMGFSPSDVRTKYEGKAAIYQLDKRLNERRSRLMTLWSRAKMMEDQNEMDSIWDEIQGFNEKNPSRRITRINLNQSYRNRQRRIDRAEDGIYLPRNRQDARDAGYFAFGE